MQELQQPLPLPIPLPPPSRLPLAHSPASHARAPAQAQAREQGEPYGAEEQGQQTRGGARLQSPDPGQRPPKSGEKSGRQTERRQGVRLAASASSTSFTPTGPRSTLSAPAQDAGASAEVAAPTSRRPSTGASSAHVTPTSTAASSSASDQHFEASVQARRWREACTQLARALERRHARGEGGDALLSLQLHRLTAAWLTSFESAAAASGSLTGAGAAGRRSRAPAGLADGSSVEDADAQPNAQSDAAAKEAEAEEAAGISSVVAHLWHAAQSLRMSPAPELYRRLSLHFVSHGRLADATLLLRDRLEAYWYAGAVRREQEARRKRRALDEQRTAKEQGRETTSTSATAARAEGEREMETETDADVDGSLAIQASLTSSGLAWTFWIVRRELNRISDDPRRQDEYLESIQTLGEVLQKGLLPLPRDEHTAWILARVDDVLKRRAGEVDGALKQELKIAVWSAAVHQTKPAHATYGLLNLRALTTLLSMVLRHHGETQLALDLVDHHVGEGKLTPDAALRNVGLHHSGRRQKDLPTNALQELLKLKSMRSGEERVEEETSTSATPTSTQSLQQQLDQAIVEDDPYRVAIILRMATHSQWPGGWSRAEQDGVLRSFLEKLWPEYISKASSPPSALVGADRAPHRELVAPRTSENAHVMVAALNLTYKLGHPALARRIWHVMIRKLRHEPRIDARGQAATVPLHAATAYMGMLARKADKARRMIDAIEPGATRQHDRRVAGSPVRALDLALTAHPVLWSHWHAHGQQPDLGYFAALLRVYQETFSASRLAPRPRHVEALHAILAHAQLARIELTQEQLRLCREILARGSSSSSSR